MPFDPGERKSIQQLRARINEYREWTMRMNLRIMHAPNVLRTAKAFAEHLYNDGSSPETSWTKSGSIHTVIGAGSAGYNPVAIRYRSGFPYRIFLTEEKGLDQKKLERELFCFELAHAAERNPPFFVSVLTFPPYDGSEEYKNAAVITEDVTRGGKLPIKEIPCTVEEFLRTNEDGTKTRFYLDPELPDVTGRTCQEIQNYADGSWYTRPEARIDTE